MRLRAVPGVDPLPRSLAFRRIALRLGAGLVLALGCAQVFGIEEACQFGDEGCSLERPCAEYCRLVSDKCSEVRPQYDDARDECESLCVYLESSPGGDATNDTLACRLERARSSGGERQSDCDGAGRGSNGACGTNCDAYCSLMRGICPDQYEAFDPSAADDDEGSCQRVCAAMEDANAAYTPLPYERNPRLDAPGRPTLDCRFWHLGTAAIEKQQDGVANTFHCDHAFGVTECEPVILATP